MESRNSAKLNKKKIAIGSAVASLVAIIAIIFIILACYGVFDQKQEARYRNIVLQFDLNLPNGETTTTEVPETIHIKDLLTGGVPVHTFTSLPSVENTENYNFVGWKFQDESVIYASGESLTISSDFNTLYAVWEKKN